MTLIFDNLACSSRGRYRLDAIERFEEQGGLAAKGER